MNNIVTSILQQDVISSLLKENERKYIFSQLNLTVESDLSCEEQCRLAFFLINSIFSNEQTATQEVVEMAYKLLKSINISSDNNVKCFSDNFGIDGINSETLYYFYLANIALKADKLISIRIDLKEYESKESNSNWKFRLLNKALEAYILLVRKQNGFKDIESALSIIEALRQEQQQYEEKYLKQFSTANEVEEAYILLAIYHLSKAVVETAIYLKTGYDYKGIRLDATIRQHLDIAKKLTQKEERLVSTFNLFEFGLKTMFNNSIWEQTKNIANNKIKQLCNKKAELGMLELLPSQRDALTQNIFDINSNVTVLQLPTSAGKTLLAEFNIIVTKALMPDAKIVYIVPSRALVNQVYYDLKSDLESLNFSIEKTSSAIEIDPAENAFLTGNEKIDILVSTPEKLDLLIRRRHSSVEDVSLFILDEAHTIQNGERGAKLELLMAILRREKPNAKYMLLSPFIKNAGNTLTEWLGGGNSVAVDWKPSEKLILGIDTKINTRKNELHIEVLPSPYESIEPIGKTIFQNSYQIESIGKKNQILESSIKQFAERGKTFLILCQGKSSTNSRAEFIYDKIDNYIPNDDVKLVQKFIEDEVGRATTLSKVIGKGIVTHHSGMSDETKLLIEHLIRERQIQYVCATTTIAEGVNFPVSTVFFDDYRKGQYSKLSANDFWNIAGRAGRTLVDNYGKILLPFNSDANIQTAKELLKNSANELVSVLADLFENADVIEQTLNEEGLSKLLGKYSNSLSPLIQYFVHLLSVGENEYYVTEIEDLFKDSLEYYLLDTEDKKQRFISICKSIYLYIQSKFQDKGVLTFADKTGFSVPSVLSVMVSASQNPNIKNLDTWTKEEIFNKHNSDNLAEKISVIAALKETKLGIEASTLSFNPDLYAKIIINWVKGEKLVNIADLHPTFNIQNKGEREAEKRITDFVKKMNDIRFKASWGLSALEGIVRGNENEIKDSFIPSLVYFGVDNEKSLALRMIGVPRTLSASLQNILQENLKQYSFSDLRHRVKELTNADWDALKPSDSQLNGMEWKRISEILVK
ncbi:MAG: DEAD/DEAH box helicase [Bacteroidales bacterium]|jgi:replicative superfamily II helicase|nr:DEAD/DEAH box helicase [Bacteroidales bacterium]